MKCLCMHVNAHRWRSEKQERQNIPFASYIVFIRMHTRSEKKRGQEYTTEHIHFFFPSCDPTPHNKPKASENIILGINDKRKKKKTIQAIQTSMHTWAHKPYIEVGKLWRCPIKRLLQSVFFSFRLLFWSLLLLLWFCISKYK